MSEAKKIVLKLDLHDDKCKRKAMTKASGLPGIDSVSLDKDQKLTVIGDIDPVMVVKKLKKLCCSCRADLVSVGPAKEPKKDEKPKEGAQKPPEPPKKPPKETVTPTCPCTVICPPPIATCYYPYYCTSYGSVVVEDPPSTCVIL